MSIQCLPNEVMTSSLPLLIPLLLFSFLSGVLAEYSHWFGSFFVLVSVAVYATTYRIGTVKKVAVKPLEVTLLGILVPIFAISSALSSFHFPQAKMTISFALITLLIPHFALLWRMRFEMNQISSVITSSIQMGFGLVGTGFTYKKGWVAVVLNLAILAYGVAVKCGAIAALRERMPLTKTRIGWLISSMVFTCVSIASYIFFPIPPVFLISTAIAVTSAIIFGFIDYLIHLMQTPEAEWFTFNSLPNLHLAIKLLSVLIVACYGVMGIIARPENMRDVIGEGFWSSMLLDLVVLLFAHVFLSAAVCRLRSKDPLHACQPMNKMAIFGFSAILAAIAVMVSVACYYCNISHPSVVHESFMLASVAALYILMIYLFDLNRSYLARFYGKLIAAVTGVAVYTALCGFYWRSIAGFVLSIIPNPVPANNGNSTEVPPTESGILASKEEIEPIKRTVFVAELLCLALVIHLVFCLIFQRTKRQRLMRQMASAAAAPAPALIAPSKDGNCTNAINDAKERLLPVV